MPFIKTAEIILSYISLFINMFIKYFVWEDARGMF